MRISTETLSQVDNPKMAAFSLTLGKRGPQGLHHIPRFYNDCYYQRPGGCCWLCHARLGLSIGGGVER